MCVIFCKCNATSGTFTQINLYNETYFPRFQEINWYLLSIVILGSQTKRGKIKCVWDNYVAPNFLDQKLDFWNPGVFWVHLIVTIESNIS